MQSVHSCPQNGRHRLWNPIKQVVDRSSIDVETQVKKWNLNHLVSVSDLIELSVQSRQEHVGPFLLKSPANVQSLFRGAALNQPAQSTNSMCGNGHNESGASKSVDECDQLRIGCRSRFKFFQDLFEPDLETLLRLFMLQVNHFNCGPKLRNRGVSRTSG